VKIAGFLKVDVKNNTKNIRKLSGKVTGVFFVGLRAPHIARALIGFRNQLFLPVAILIALIGAPYFMYLLMKK
jgi:ABC-type Fe3+-siderophore transport system permease subunit